VWKKLADLCRDHLQKGDLVFIEGEITNSSWTDENGKKHQSSEIKAKRILFF
jgi:single-strand DNA-binding protein